jgi:hypothetical protein
MKFFFMPFRMEEQEKETSGPIYWIFSCAKHSSSAPTRQQEGHKGPLNSQHQRNQYGRLNGNKEDPFVLSRKEKK